MIVGCKDWMYKIGMLKSGDSKGCQLRMFSKDVNDGCLRVDVYLI
jgi:hypothetical protein